MHSSRFLKNIKFNLVIKVVFFSHAHPHIINHHKYCPMISLFFFPSFFFVKLWFTKQAHTVDRYIWFKRTLWRMLAVFFFFFLLTRRGESQCTNKKAVVKSSRNIYKVSTNGSEYKRATALRDTTPIHEWMIWYWVTVLQYFNFCDGLNEKLYRKNKQTNKKESDVNL